MSPLERTIKEQKKLNRTCGIVERFIHNNKVPPGVRSDLFGMFDLVSMGKDQGIIGVQACGKDYGSHLKKITQEKKNNAKLWLSCGGKIEIWSWRKLKSGWQPRIKSIGYDDF